MLFNTTVSSSSPLLSYVPQLLWNEGNANDPHLNDYATQSYRSTDGQFGNASVSFRWNGTGIWVYGAYRSRLGPYQVSLDSNSVMKPGYQTGNDEQYQYLLFGERNLNDGYHELQLSNASPGTGNFTLDLDYIIFESHVPDTGDVEFTALNSTSFKFSPGMPSWQLSQESCYTSDPAGAVRILFNGNGFRCIIRILPFNLMCLLHRPTLGSAVAVYGQLSNLSSSLIATLDSWNSRQLTSNILTNSGLGNESEHLIYFVSGLEDTEHELEISNNPSWDSPSKNVLNITYAVSISSSSITSEYPSGPHNNGHRDIMIAISTTGVSIVVFGIYLILSQIYKKWRRERGMHVVFDYSKAPRPYPVLFFSDSRGMENERRGRLDRLLGANPEALQHRRKPDLHQQDLRRSEFNEVVDSDSRIGGGASEQVRRRTAGKTSGDSRPNDQTSTAHNPVRPNTLIQEQSSPSEFIRVRGGISTENLPVPPVPSPTARIPRAGSDRIDVPYVRPPPSSQWQSQVAFEWPGEAPPRYREVL